MVGIVKQAVTLLTVVSVCAWSSASAESTEVVSQTGSGSVAPAPAPATGGGLVAAGGISTGTAVAAIGLAGVLLAGITSQLNKDTKNNFTPSKAPTSTTATASTTATSGT